MAKFEITWEVKQSGLTGHWTNNVVQHKELSDAVKDLYLLSRQNKSVRNIKLSVIK